MSSGLPKKRLNRSVLFFFPVQSVWKKVTAFAQYVFFVTIKLITNHLVILSDSLKWNHWIEHTRIIISRAISCIICKI